MPQACNFIKKGTLPQVFSYEFYEISRSTFYRAPLDDSFCTYPIYLFCNILESRRGHDKTDIKYWANISTFTELIITIYFNICNFLPFLGLICQSNWTYKIEPSYQPYFQLSWWRDGSSFYEEVFHNWWSCHIFYLFSSSFLFLPLVIDLCHLYKLYS